MQSYFVGHTEVRERGLRDARVPFEPFRMERQRGVVFEEQYLTQALAAMSSQVESEEASMYDGVRILHLRRTRSTDAPSRTPVQVTAGRVASFSNQTHHRKAVELLQEMGPDFGVQEIVLIQNELRDTVLEPRTAPNTFTVFLWSSPRNADTVSHGSASTLWGHRISTDRGHWVRFQPSGIGEIIRDDAGTDVAELVGNNLFVLYPINDARVSTFIPVFRRILEEALLLRGTPEQRAERARQHEVRLREEAEKEPVVVEHWGAVPDQRDKFVAVAREFAPIFGRQIRISNHADSAKVVYPISDGRLHVCIWASPGNTESGGMMPSTLFGAPFKSSDNHQCILKPTGEEGQLLLDECDQQVGKIVGNTVYIHYPLGMRHLQLHWNSKGADALFRRILEEVAFWKTATEQEKSARARALAEKNRAKSREEYIRACNGRFDKALASTRKAAQEGPQEVRRLQEALTKKIREVNSLQRKLGQMEATFPNVTEMYGKEFDKLLQVPKIRDVRVREGAIQVFTDTLYCVDPRSNKKHEIGNFRIEFGLSGTVRWHNLTRLIGGCHAPHVLDGGEACLGNMAEVIPELIANYEFAALAMVCIQFVESVNVDDRAGALIHKWPVAA